VTELIKKKIIDNQLKRRKRAFTTRMWGGWATEDGEETAKLAQEQRRGEFFLKKTAGRIRAGKKGKLQERVENDKPISQKSNDQTPKKKEQ